jgi:conjugative transposon TraM protein
MITTVKKRKMLLVIPLLVIPFLTMAFWALGGGSKKKVSDDPVNGLNLAVPDAHLKEDQLMDKLGFYDKAEKDSLKMEEWMRSDPYFQRDTAPANPFADELQEMTNSRAVKYNQRLNPSPYEKGESNPEEKILQKLKLLEMEMNKPTQEEPVMDAVRSTDPDFSSQVDRLENMLHLQGNTATADPEMQQLEGTLDKILDIQHPQRVKERQREKSKVNKGSVYAVHHSAGNDTTVKGFYGLSDEQEISEHNTIEAVVHENQTLVNGAVVKFRLVNAIYIGGKLVPEGSIVYGTAQLEGERLTVEVNSIRSVKNLFDVKLAVYDIDGLPGIYIPGTITRDVAKQSADNSLSVLEMGSLDPSLKAQATAAGVSAAKSLLSRKVKLVKVLVKAGYKVFLKDKNIER